MYGIFHVTQGVNGSSHVSNNSSFDAINESLGNFTLAVILDIGSLENSSESNSANNLNLNFTNTANSMVNTEESIYESLWETGQPYPRENETQNSRKEETRFSQAESEVRAVSRIVLNYV